ncbi:hypothetical protein GH714_014097 [Hevea brasiliensis]|uniref:Uncharacterized protein n=1 Tax=Hevea brasiliensis TaxID=3981 RepID=A0A6A6LNX8_HEVBR|nr:hypothetical protein GH714_014097 [Hevea brasiliensis]
MASSNYSTQTPPAFNGENYSVWVVKMKVYLRAFDLWEVVEISRDPTPLPENPSLPQIKMHSEERVKKFKARSAIHAFVTNAIFTRIMTCETAKQAWDKLKEDYQGTNRIRLIQVLNLWREFEVLKMKDVETVKNYTKRLMKVVNKLRLIGEELSNKRIAQKVLVSVPESKQIDPVVAWTDSISRHCRNGQLPEAASQFTQMLLSGVEPNHITFTTLLSGCADFPSEGKSFGPLIHSYARKLGFDTCNVMVGTALVDMYAKCGQVELARFCFYELKIKNSVSWNTMMDGYMRNGG